MFPGAKWPLKGNVRPLFSGHSIANLLYVIDKYTSASFQGVSQYLIIFYVAVITSLQVVKQILLNLFLYVLKGCLFLFFIVCLISGISN